MLVEFRVKNFRSLKDEQVLSFASSKADKTFASTHRMDTEHKPVPSLTRSALIYGANAAGKSNLMFAIATMRNLVLGASVSGTRLSDHYTPFPLSRDSATDPTEFEVSVIIDNKRYQNRFAYDGVRVRREWLLVCEHARAQRWFERSADYSDKEDQ
jgi:AAA15 family ATPase/GTPase